MLLLLAGALAVRAQSFEFEPGPGKLEINVEGRPLAAYVYEDPQILRPYLAHLKLPSGTQITRRHPPVEGQDATDHATMHPGLWLGFGRISGSDFWRNKARVEHVDFLEPPSTRHGRGTFAVRNRYRDGDRMVCEQTCRYDIRVVPGGYLISIDTTFTPAGEEFYFGAQDEMGLGIRLATPIAVRNGGTMIDSEGRKNEKEIWGKAARWLDYHGTIDGKKAGAMLMPHPQNPRPAWFHARDYGFVVANPFEHEVRDNQPRVVVKRGESYRLRFGVFLHEGDVDLEAAYHTYVNEP